MAGLLAAASNNSKGQGMTISQKPLRPVRPRRAKPALTPRSQTAAQGKKERRQRADVTGRASYVSPRDAFTGKGKQKRSPVSTTGQSHQRSGRAHQIEQAEAAERAIRNPSTGE